MHTIHQHTYPNGLTLLVEPMTGVASAGLTLLLPAGVAAEPDDRVGTGAVLAEMLWRGAGERDAREHSDALDRLGVHRSSSVQTWHTRIGAATIGDRLHDALPLLIDAARRPTLDESAFEPSRQLALQSLAGLEDEPQQRVMVELKKAHQPTPLGRNSDGEVEALNALTLDEVRAYYASRFVPDGAILGVAGAVDFKAVRDSVGKLIDGWTGSASDPAVSDLPLRRYHHHEADSAQVHIAMGYDTVPEGDAETMTQRVAIAVLSGGMSGRLFTEVREERGLCYSVFASYAAQRGRGSVYAYAGTTPERAGETLDVLTGELVKLSDGVEADEFNRAMVGLKSRLVMQGESTSARAGAIAADQFLLGSPRTLEDLAAQIEAVTLDRVNAFVASHRPEAFTTLTVGPQALREATV